MSGEDLDLYSVSVPVGWKMSYSPFSHLQNGAKNGISPSGWLY